MLFSLLIKWMSKQNFYNNSTPTAIYTIWLPYALSKILCTRERNVPNVASSVELCDSTTKIYHQNFWLNLFHGIAYLLENFSNFYV